MTRRHRLDETDLDLAPPDELLALRDALMTPPSETVRTQHVVAATAASRLRVASVPVNAATPSACRSTGEVSRGGGV